MNINLPNDLWESLASTLSNVDLMNYFWIIFPIIVIASILNAIQKAKKRRAELKELLTRMSFQFEEQADLSHHQHPPGRPAPQGRKRHAHGGGEAQNLHDDHAERCPRYGGRD